MTQMQILQRIETLERELRDIRQKVDGIEPRLTRKSSRDFIGMFHHDEDFKKAMEAGAAYRRSLRPSRSVRRKKPK